MKTSQTSQYSNEGLGPKKTMFVMVTVVGCIAILWPKVFYPMMFGSSPPQQPYKDFRPGGAIKCCEVILDEETFLNASAVPIGPQLFRKNYNFFPEEISLRQERPPHLRPEGIHPAMRERGRAIPNTQTVPIIDRARSSRDAPPRIVEGRPGPIPGMRPPMGAGSVHQAQPKGNSMGIIMPLYTIAIIAFFCYTIVKLAFKKPQQNEPYGSAQPNLSHKKDIYTENGAKKYRPEGPKIGWKEQAAIVTAVQGLIDEYDNTYGDQATSDHKDTNEASNQNGNISNGHATKPKHNNENEQDGSNVENLLKKDEDPSQKLIDNEKEKEKETKISENKSSSDRKKPEGSVDKSVTVMGMELTASFEGGQKWYRPVTPEFPHHQHSSASHHTFNGQEEPKSIYLEGSLPHESQILVADAEVKTERASDFDWDEDDIEPAVVLSSKISLSLINVSSGEEGVDDDEEQPNTEIDDIPADFQNKEKDSEENQEEKHQETEENKELSDEN